MNSIQIVSLFGGAAILSAFAWLASVQWQLMKLRRSFIPKQSRDERRRLDTQKNAYGRIKNALEPLGMKSSDERGVVIHALGNFLGRGDTYHVNVFWKNEFHSLGILGISIETHGVKIESLSAPCPQGQPINYAVSLSESDVTRAIADAQKFISETYQVAYQAARAGAR